MGSLESVSNIRFVESCSDCELDPVGHFQVSYMQSCNDHLTPSATQRQFSMRWTFTRHMISMNISLSAEDRNTGANALRHSATPIICWRNCGTTLLRCLVVLMGCFVCQLHIALSECQLRMVNLTDADSNGVQLIIGRNGRVNR